MSRVRMLVRIIPSSSTSKMDGLRFSDTFFQAPFALTQRNVDVKRRAASPLALEIDSAVMVGGDDLLHDRQAQAGPDAERLGGEFLLQNFVLVLGANARAGVGDPDMDHAIFH